MNFFLEKQLKPKKFPTFFFAFYGQDTVWSWNRNRNRNFSKVATELEP
jgi:hypothetical protein